MFFRKLKQSSKVKEESLEVVSQSKKRWWNIQWLFLATRRLSDMHRMNRATPKDIVAELDQVLDISDHILATIDIDLCDQTELFN